MSTWGARAGGSRQVGPAWELVGTYFGCVIAMGDGGGIVMGVGSVGDPVLGGNCVR